MSSSRPVEEVLGKSDFVAIARGRTVVDIQLPKDDEAIGLTARQAVGAVVEPHGNAGRSKIRFTLEVEVEAHGTAESNKERIKRGLLAENEDLTRRLSLMRDELSAAKGELDRYKQAEREKP